MTQIQSQPQMTIGQLANSYAQENAFSDYQSRQAQNTLRRQAADLKLFGVFMGEAGIKADFSRAESWVVVTWGLVEAFVKWQLAQGYAVGSVNVRLATIKRYANLATQAGTMDIAELQMVRTVKGYSRKETKRIDAGRETTRIGHKKAEPTILTQWQADSLKQQPDTPQGRRDGVLMAILLDHGLRCSEVALLTVEAFVLTEKQFRFYRPKVDKWQRHELTADSFEAVNRYLAHDLSSGPLIRGSRKGSRLTENGLSIRNIARRVTQLGQVVGIDSLSPHDCRHYWATQAARSGTPIDKLQQAGGWSNYQRPLEYINEAEIANEGVRLR